MTKLIPNSDSLPVPAHNVHEAFPPAKAAKKKAAAPFPPDEEEPVEDDDEFEDEDEDAEVEDEDAEDEEEPVEDDDEEQSAQSATVKVTVTAAPNRPAAPAKAPAPKKGAPPPLPKKKKKPSRPARGFTEAAMDAVVESYIRPLREYTTKSGKHVEIHSPKWHRCVEHVKQRGDVDNAYAVCTASLGAGKSLKKGHGGSA
jgi:hypothetical protein